jgi:hypothetical protein
MHLQSSEQCQDKITLLGEQLMAGDFEDIFGRMRDMMRAAAPSMTVAKNDAGSLELRTPDIDAKTGQPGWFGTVTVKKGYVAYHLMPLYSQPPDRGRC